MKKPVELGPGDPDFWLLAGAGSGFLPKMPGTWGSLLALGLASLLCHDHGLIFGVDWGGGHWRFLVLFVLAGTLYVLAVPRIRQYISGADKDPSWIVVDEVIGMWAALSVPWLWQRSWLPLMVFLFFRLFDIWKPWPVSYFDRRYGSHDLILDDVAAGLMAALCGMALLYITRFVEIFGL